VLISSQAVFMVQVRLGDPMGNLLGMAAQLAGDSFRFGWYYGVSWVAGRQAARLGPQPRVRPMGPMPSMQEVLRDLALLFMSDAAGVRDGLYPPMEGTPGSVADHLARVWEMLNDLPSNLERREARDAGTARLSPEAADLPDYFTQDFHFQTGGYLTEQSARLYDVQVETLFYGAANVMRRSALRPIAEYLRGRDQRVMTLLDVACGTGRSLRQMRLAFPALRLVGLDLSRPYLDEAAAHMGDLRHAEFIRANAEDIPLGDAGCDIVTSTFLYHELPPAVRPRVTAEIARVLKPGGLFVFIDSVQRGDKPGWDGLLEVFPARFHEPYYRHYAVDDLDAMFADAGLEPQASWVAFFSKVMVRRKT
jgi:ubiquinone/menaquinone biosynthesis C-methylase UbiE